MSSNLTNRQADELHKSIIAYLAANDLPKTAEALRGSLKLGSDVFDATTAQKYETLLEKKWTSTVRLQKKVMDLESRHATLKAEMQNVAAASTTKKNQDPAEWLPRSPPRYSLESHNGTINCIAFHPIFSSIASGSDDYTIKIWDWELGELERTIKGHTRAVLDIDYGGPRGGVLLASCSSDLTIKLWDPAEDYKNIRTLAGHDHSVSTVRFMTSSSGMNTTGSLLVSASGDQTLKIWDVTNGYCLRTIEGHTGWIRDVCPSTDGNFLLSAGSDQTVRLWDISKSTPENKLTMIGHENVIKCCAFAPPSSYQNMATLAGQKKAPPASNTAEYMATGARDKTIKLWDANGTCIKTLVGHDNWISALVFHPGGRYLLSVADDKTLRCWDLSQDAKCVKVLGEAHDQFITCLRWAPGIAKDTTAAASAAVDGTNGTPKKGGAAAAASTPDVRIRCVIATGSSDMTIKVFAG